MTPADAPRHRVLDVLDRRRAAGDVGPCRRCGYPELTVEPAELTPGAPAHLEATWVARCPACRRNNYLVTPSLEEPD